MDTRPLITDLERRRRLVARHHLRRTATSLLDATRAVVAMHSSDPLTPYLGLYARVPEVTRSDIDEAFYARRDIWRLHSMRRTLWVVPTDDGPTFLAGASQGVAAKERSRVEGWLAPVTGDPTGWLADVTSQVGTLIAAAEGTSTSSISAAIPAMATKVEVGSGTWSTEVAIGSRVLFLMALDGLIVRGRPAGTWRSSQYAWHRTGDWFATAGLLPDDLPDERIGRHRLAALYLASFGPATLDDVRWWTGWTMGRTRTALADCEATGVLLEDGQEGYVLPGDEAGTADPAPSVAFLPGLDPTPMGWKNRGWYLGGHREALFDRNGNVGPTVWVDGRIVGGWAQRSDGKVVYRLLEDLGAAREAGTDREARALEAWLDGTVVTPRFRAPLERTLATG